MELSLSYDDRLLCLRLTVIPRLSVCWLPIGWLSIGWLSIWHSVCWRRLSLLLRKNDGGVVIASVVHGVHGCLLLELFCLFLAIAVADDGQDDDETNDWSDDSTTDGTGTGAWGIVITVVIPAAIAVRVVIWVVSIVGVAAIGGCVVAAVAHLDNMELIIKCMWFYQFYEPPLNKFKNELESTHMSPCF